MLCDKCWCGDEPDPLIEADASECDFPCVGNEDEICGGYTKMSLYCFTDTPTAPSPVAPPAPTPSCDTFTDQGCFIDQKQDRIMSTVSVRSPMSAQVCARLYVPDFGYHPKMCCSRTTRIQIVSIGCSTSCPVESKSTGLNNIYVPFEARIAQQGCASIRANGRLGILCRR